jgi:8-oxo-dGTP pyrophosphatase MutT (NUDIX family)
MSELDLVSLESHSSDMRIARSIVLNDANELLLARRSLSVRRNPGGWELPGGQVEDNDIDLESAGAREVWEETGKGLITIPLTQMVEVYSYRMDGGEYEGRINRTYCNISQLSMGNIAPNSEAMDFAWLPIDTAENKAGLLKPSLQAIQKLSHFVLQRS